MRSAARAPSASPRRKRTSLEGFLARPRAGIDDAEGARIDPGLPPVIDMHVHLFPDRLFAAVWRWFDTYGWPIRYKLPARDVVRFLLDRGVRRIVALHYAHKPGIARGLNAFVAAICREEPRVTGLATVMPGEPDARKILDEAFASGLQGVKLHPHVQCFAPDEPRAHEVYAACETHDAPIVIHAGREPASPGYRCDPRALCSADRIERVLRDHPKLRVCVPHLGMDEVRAYEKMLERHDNLWLDTTMALAGFFPGVPETRLLFARPDRVMYGTDFPNVPHAWDRELRAIARLGLSDESLARVLSGTACEFFRL